MDQPARRVAYGSLNSECRCLKLVDTFRNPMYVGVLTVILGWAILFSSVVLVVYGLVLGTCFHLFTVLL